MFVKNSILNIWQGSEYASALTQNHSDILEAICIICQTSLCWALEDIVTFKDIGGWGWIQDGGGDSQNLAKKEVELKTYLNGGSYPCKEGDSTFLCQKLNWEGWSITYT